MPKATYSTTFDYFQLYNRKIPDYRVCKFQKGNIIIPIRSLLQIYNKIRIETHLIISFHAVSDAQASSHAPDGSISINYTNLEIFGIKFHKCMYFLYFEEISSS